MLKTLLIDDEENAINLIAEYLGNFPDFQIAGICRNGIDAVDSINILRPDLIFLDIQMPGYNGFEVLNRIDHIPAIIFTTAYDNYAIQAFEHNTIDYLLKPYTKNRFNKAISRWNGGKEHHFWRLASLSAEIAEPYLNRILLYLGQKLMAVNTCDIIFMEASDDYTKVFCTDNLYLSNSGISYMEKKLDPKQFIRIHRSTIVNVNHIKSIDRNASGYVLMLSSGTSKIVSRSYADSIKKRIL